MRPLMYIVSQWSGRGELRRGPNIPKTLTKNPTTILLEPKNLRRDSNMEGLEPTSPGGMRKQTFKRMYNWPRATRPDEEVSSLFSTSGGRLFLSCLPCSQGDRFSVGRRPPCPGDHSEAGGRCLMGSQEEVHWAVETEPPSPLSRAGLC